MKKVFFIYLVFLTIGTACNQTGNDAIHLNIPERNVFNSFQSQRIFEKLSESEQVFSNLSLVADTVIKCKKGTEIYIPQNCFVNKYGQEVNDSISIKVIEANSFNDFLNLKLQTSSNGDLLSTAGMMFIDVSRNDEPLQLKDSSKMYFEFPAISDESDLKLFSGERDSLGNINWTEDSPIDNQLIPLPLKELNLKYYTFYKFTNERLGIYYLDSVIIIDSIYENTFIATEEFEYRFNALMTKSSIWWEGNENYMNNLNDTDSWEKYMTKKNKVFKINCEPLKIYLENTDKPLWYADSLVQDYLRRKAVKDSVRWSKTQYSWKNQNVFFQSSMFEYYVAERLTNSKYFNLKGLTPTKPNLKEKLIQKGYTESEAIEQVFINRARLKFIKKRNDARKRRKLEIEADSAINSGVMLKFGTNKLGWINIDRYYQDPRAKEVELLVVISDNTFDFIEVVLILPKEHVMLNAYEKSFNRFSFTKPSKMYSKLPIGEYGILIGLGMKNDSIYFEMKDLTIKEKQLINLDLNKNDLSKLKEELADL